MRSLPHDIEARTVLPRAAAATCLALAVLGASTDDRPAGDERGPAGIPDAGPRVVTAIVMPAGDGRDGAPAVVDRVLRVAIGSDGTVASVVTLRGPGAHEAVLRRRGDTSTLVARTGTPVVTASGRTFGLRAVGRAWTADGTVLYLATTQEGPSVLVLHDADGSRVVAFGPDPAGALLADGERVTLPGSGCAVELEVFELLGAEAAPLLDGSTVRFPARLGAPCADGETVIGYRHGRYTAEAPGVARTDAAPTGTSTVSPPWRRAGDDHADVADGSAGTYRLQEAEDR